ncbi:MAG: HD domain-containing protein [Bacilli bacterium]|nr:HD domain-containing protein [Bacilli bacterium]
MDVKESAMNFAIKAFDGKVRKAEPEKDSVLHSIDVANKLMSFGFDDNVVAAGYLHDVVEDTEFTLEDIRKKFGNDIASLVKGATEEDRTLSWEERKQGTINRIKDLDLRHKAVIACDKISNSEDLLYLFGRKGKEDYSSFKRGKNKKKWYWEEVYKSLIYNQDKNLPIFKELRNNIDNIFYKNQITTNPNDIIKFKKLELYKLENIIKNKSSYNIVIAGNSFKENDKIKKALKEIIDINKISINRDKNSIIEKLIIIDINYLNNKLPSDTYIELLYYYVNYIRNNIDKIIYVISNINTYDKYKKSETRIFNMLKNNNIEFDIINNKKDIKITILKIYNIILTTIREKRLNDIKKLIKKRQRA